jgi:GT2 family glycosyltransferase
MPVEYGESAASARRQPKQAVVFLTHRDSERINRHFERLRRDLRDVMPVFFCQHRPDPEASAPLFDPDITISLADGARLLPRRYAEWMTPGRSKFAAYTDLALIPAMLHPQLETFEHIWIIEYDVDFTGDWRTFFDWAARSSADLIGFDFATRTYSLDWMHWAAFSAPTRVPPEKCMRGLFSLARFSKRFLNIYREEVRDPSWKGHTEGLFPTIALHHGLPVATFGSVNSCFEAPSIAAEASRPPFDFADKRNFNADPVQGHSYFQETPAAFGSMNRLYHPIKVEGGPVVATDTIDPQLPNRQPEGRPAGCTAALVASHLLVAGRISKREPVTAVDVSAPLETVAAVAAECRFPLSGPTHGQQGAGPVGFVLACPLDFKTAREIAAAEGSLTLRLRSDTHVLAEHTVPVGSFEEAGMDGYAEAVRMLSGGLAESSPQAAKILSSVASAELASPTIDCKLTARLVAPECGMVVAGRVDRFFEGDVVFLLDECRLAVDPAQIIVTTGRGSDAGVHTFTFVETTGGRKHQLRLAAVSDSGVSWSDPLTIDETCSPQHLLQAAAKLVPSRTLIGHPAVAGSLRNIAARRPPAASVAVTEHVANEVVPDMSIIIPFYRDDFFLLDHLESQRRTGANAEWIFVCDDPALLPAMTETCRARRGSMEKATKLVAPSTNVGYAAANNIGARHAAADILVFMNSDVHWRSFAPLELGLRLMRQDETIGAVGFMLHFEDGTLQHAGMELQVMPELDDLMLTVHEGKGLPGREFGPAMSVREVAAVTGALMMVRRSDFGDSVFDEAYVGGDFEDGDLCLRLRARGKKVVLVECSGLFHLERQSMRGDEMLSLLSMLNCMRFNEKWRAQALGMM